MSGKNSTMITRGKVQLARIGPRTFLQVTGLDGETFQNIELLLPPGYVASPVTGADVLLLQTNGVRSHIVAAAGDNTADAVANLQPGEFGIATNGKRVILRQDYVEIVDPAEIRLVTPLLRWSPDGVNFYRLADEQHTHPDVQLGGSSTPPPSTGLT